MLMFLLVAATAACIREEDITIEQRLYQLSGQLLCPVCSGQTIDGSNAQIAQDMRAKVRDLLDSGNTNAEIKEYFVARYGQEILASPEGGGFNLIAWIVPVFIAFGGIGIALLTIRNLKRSHARVAVSAGGGRADLSEFLARIDQDLGLPDGSIPHEAKTSSPGIKSVKTKNPGPEKKAAS